METDAVASILITVFDITSETSYSNFPVYELNEHGLIILYHTIELGNLANYK